MEALHLMNEHEHTHEHEHEHEHEHHHSHAHTHTETQAVLNRISRAIGHLQSVKRMMEDGRDCSEVLIQLAAVRSALGGVSRVILKDHISHCLVEAAEEHDTAAIEELSHAIDHLMK